MRGRLGAVLDGAGWSVGLAAALFVFALLFVALDFQSPEIVLWTGHHVVATEQGGLATFRWHGQAYTVDVPGFGSGKVDIYFSPGDPSGAMADNVPDRVFSGRMVGVPVIAGVAVLVGTAWTRKRRWARRQSRGTASYGDGLDPEFVARQLKAYRGDRQ